MQKVLYTYNELELQLNAFIFQVSLRSEYYSNCYEVLSKTGCRPTELFNPDRWTIFEDTYVRLLPAKGNHPRLLNFNLFPSGYITSIYNNKIQSSELSRPTFERLFYQLFYRRPTFILDKGIYQPIGIYLFRHFRMKQKFNELGSIEAVSNWFGEADHKNTENYILSQLFYSLP